MPNVQAAADVANSPLKRLRITLVISFSLELQAMDDLNQVAPADGKCAKK